MFTIKKTAFGFVVSLNGIEAKLFSTEAAAEAYVASLRKQP